MADWMCCFIENEHRWLYWDDYWLIYVALLALSIGSLLRRNVYMRWFPLFYSIFSSSVSPSLSPFSPYLYLSVFCPTHITLSLISPHPVFYFLGRTLATIRAQMLGVLAVIPEYQQTTSLLLTANHNENCRFRSQKERKGGKKSEERCLVSKQRLTLGAARAAGWVPEFPCFCLRLHILFLRNLTHLTSLNMSGFTLPSDTQSQCTVIESLYESKSPCLFFASSSQR